MERVDRCGGQTTAAAPSAAGSISPTSIPRRVDRNLTAARRKHLLSVLLVPRKV